MKKNHSILPALATPPADPGLLGFLEILAGLAAESVLANYRESKACSQASINSPQGLHRTQRVARASRQDPHPVRLVDLDVGGGSEGREV